MYNLSRHEKLILSILKEETTLRELIIQLPIQSYKALKAIETAITNNLLVLHEPEKQSPEEEALNENEVLFYEYKAACKKIVSARNSVDKVKGLIRFCKDNFDQTCVISMTKTTLIRSYIFFKDSHNNYKNREVHNVKCNIEDDPVFLRAYSSGFSFFGKVFPTAVINSMIELPEAGECAVIPLGKKEDRVNLIYAISTKTSSDIDPFHYLELLSWMVNPNIESPMSSKRSEPTSNGNQSDVHLQEGSLESKSDEKKLSLAEAVDDLPPMPHLASKMLQILSDPESSVDELTAVLGQDQSIMATLIKVSNSALYRTGEEITTLNKAVTRLGFKTIRSLVLTATTHSLFPKNNAKLEVMSQSLWQHSKECGLASRRAAEFIKFSDPDEAFMAGLLHDIGKLTFLLKYTESYNRIGEMQRKGVVSVDAEKEVLGFDHTEAGGILMDKWKIPGNLSSCVKFHHMPQAEEQFSQLTNIVIFGDCFSHLFGIYAREQQDENLKILKYCATQLKLSSGDIEQLREMILEDFKEADVFD